jgi:hypothetical protein
MSTSVSEGQRRLRAAVRAVLSPGIWLLVAAQLLLGTLQHFSPAMPDDGFSATMLARAVGMATLLLLVFYLQGGIYCALARTREAVTVREALRAGREVFGRFVWLTVKAGLLFGAVLVLVLMLTQVLSGVESRDTVEGFAVPIGLGFVVLPFVFVWWLPWVFVRDDFGLTASLRAALQYFWVHLPGSAFLALLILVPGLAAWWLPPATPFLLVLAVDGASALLVWVASVYCVEWLRDQANAAATPAAA